MNFTECFEFASFGSFRLSSLLYDDGADAAPRFSLFAAALAWMGGLLKK
jgi:hypothetical protein